MATTFTLISSVTVGAGGASSIDFTSIPATYTDLILKLSARENVVGDYVRFNMSINGGATAISSRQLYGDGSSAGSNVPSDPNVGYAVDRYSATANTFANTEIYFANYASSVGKSFSKDGVEENNSSSALMGMSAHLWNSSSAITSISISSPGNLAQYSTAYLYGIKNS